MKQTFIILCWASIIVCSSCVKDASCDDPASINFGASEACIFIDSTSHALLFKMTGTWCPPCGSWGAIEMKNRLSKYPSAIGIEVHFNDNMSSEVSNKWVSHFANIDFPEFYWNNDVSSVDQLLTTKPRLGLAMSYEKKGGKMTVQTTVKALEASLSSDLFIAVYLLEDGVIENQYATDHSAHPEWEYRNGRYPNYVHDRVLRGEASNYIFGRSFRQDQWLKGEIVELHSELDLADEFGQDLYPVVAIWENNSGTFTLINALKGDY